MRGRGSIVIGLMAAAAVAPGCGDGDGGSANELDVKGVEYAFDMPSRGEGGVTTFQFSNAGAEPHEFALGRLAKGKDISDVKDYLKSGGQNPPKWFTDVGGTPVMSPGQKLGITRDLQPGKYVFLCFIPTAKGVPHVNLGMLKAFDLEGRSDEKLPSPDAVITARRGGYEIPELEAGSQTIQLKNADSREREFFLFNLRPGKSLQDLGAFFEGKEGSGEPPAALLGGMQTIPPGTSVYMDVDLKSGVKYTLSDTSAGKPIVASFTPK